MKNDKIDSFVNAGMWFITGIGILLSIALSDFLMYLIAELFHLPFSEIAATIISVVILAMTFILVAVNKHSPEDEIVVQNKPNERNE